MTASSLVLTGSRGRGVFVRPESDWDVRLVVRDEAVEECAALATPHGSAVEVVVLSLSGFERAGAVGSGTEWDRYSYVHAAVVLDKLDGRIAALVREKGSLSADDAERVGAEALDTYVNSYYRSAKNLRDGLRWRPTSMPRNRCLPSRRALCAARPRPSVQQIPRLGA